MGLIRFLGEMKKIKDEIQIMYIEDQCLSDYLPPPLLLLQRGNRWAALYRMRTFIKTQRKGGCAKLSRLILSKVWNMKRVMRYKTVESDSGLRILNKLL